MIESEIRKVCVIGAGTMGGGIAAHLLNLGFEVTLLDLTQQDAIKGLDRLRQSRPPAFYVPERSGEIRLGNIAEHLYWAGEADWVIEAVVENVSTKRTLMARLEPLLKPDAIISSNTSGIQLTDLAEGLTPAFRTRFLGTHFFNPPRYLKLIELIPTVSTDPQLVQDFSHFLEDKVARRVVSAKDTPGFIANRYGMWCLYHAIRVAEKLGLDVEDVDAITGTFLGRPKSGTFRLADIIGLDVMRDIGAHLMNRMPDDPHIKELELTSSIFKLIALGWIGDKTGHGYYRKEGRELLVLDLKTYAYRMHREQIFKDIEELSALPLRERIAKALTLKSEVGEYLREYLIPCLQYANQIKEEVSHSILDFDRVMKWGFGWELGPFELIDAVGGEILHLPRAQDFYKGEDFWKYDGTFHKCPEELQFKALDQFKEIANGETFRLRDLGDGVIAVVLTTKMGVINPTVVAELTEVFKGGLKHYVFTSEARSFSAGFDLNFFVEAISSGQFGKIADELHALQKLGELMEKIPGAAAIYGHCLGAGLELALSAPVIVANAETQIGLPESRIGLIPGGRGVTLMKQHNSFNAKRLCEVTVTMSQGVIAPNADVARQLGYLRSADVTAYNPDNLIFLAKQAALDAKPPEFGIWTASLGPLIGMIDREFTSLRSSGVFSEYDEIIGGKIKQIVGRSTSYEDAILRERNEFVDLCGRTLTQTRIKHMLEFGKPMTN